ncbi:hypothetical protein LMG23992_01886 [Cupriavidus laharis]|uniref:Uncharacterized protein n=1 Tax=Cupriavidus laharis TaxID=151654 RepID=A0ABM8WTY3_9BURK|nr:hypothetical protein LMG23992_01886 [Cupriavidus laharis]
MFRSMNSCSESAPILPESCQLHEQRRTESKLLRKRLEQGQMSIEATFDAATHLVADRKPSTRAFHNPVMRKAETPHLFRFHRTTRLFSHGIFATRSASYALIFSA